MYKTSKTKSAASKSHGKCCKGKKTPSKLNIAQQANSPEDVERGEPKTSHDTEVQTNNVAAGCSGDDIVFRSFSDFEPLQEVSSILKDLEKCKEKVFLTKKEKRCLEEITLLTSKTRVPLDNRQMHYFNKDAEKFSTNVTLPEAASVSEKEVLEAAVAVKESPSKIMATELNTLASYLNDLKNLIAKREISWASTTDNDYAQKVEIFRLKNEVNHLRVVLSKRQAELADRDRAIGEKEREIARLQKVVQRLKVAIIQIEKNEPRQQDEEQKTVKVAQNRQAKSSSLKMMEELLLGGMKNGEKVLKTPVGTMEPRRNQGPAALLANALYKARNAGNFVNF